jgi:hypothetical protein
MSDELEQVEGSDVDVPESRDAMAEIIEQIEQADSVEDVLSGGELTPADDVLDTPLIIARWRTNPGEFGDYAVLEAADGETGERLMVGCGGTLVMAQLRKLSILGAFPVRAVIRRYETSKGFRTYRLVKVPGDFTEAQVVQDAGNGEE